MTDPISDPLDPYRTRIGSRKDAIRWACVLEATAPKAGNVFPGRPFRDLCYADFVVAAEIAADVLPNRNLSLGERIGGAVEPTVQRCHTNVNLGIVLLLGPLVIADERVTADETGGFGAEGHQPTERSQASSCLIPLSPATWRRRVGEVLDEVTPADSRRIMAAIAAAGAGGMGQVEAMDVHDPAARHDDLIAAMSSAAERDRIARQYAGGFADLFDEIVPVVAEAIGQTRDVLAGIASAHLRLLATEPDTLIARKFGIDVAAEVSRRAGDVDPNDTDAVEAFDRDLRSGGRFLGDGVGVNGCTRLNPGTTADLIAAALYILLRQPRFAESESPAPDLSPIRSPNGPSR